MDSTFSSRQRDGELGIGTGFEPQSKRLKLDDSSMASTYCQREEESDTYPDSEPPRTRESPMASTSSFPQRDDEFNGIVSPSNSLESRDSSETYDVFINHRGPDTKANLATPLHESLAKVGIPAYLDKEENKLADSLSTKIKAAIFSASVHIAILSPGYAESAWCLAELTAMLRTGAPIIPVFYGVKPSDLKYIRLDSYKAAFLGHNREGRYPDKVGVWKHSLAVVSGRFGEEVIPSQHDINKLCERLVSRVKEKLAVARRDDPPEPQEMEKRNSPLEVARYKVGLDKLVENLEVHCRKMCEARGKMVGIFGIEGSGKTTLAKELFNSKSSDYTRSSFLFNVRQANANGELTLVQSKLVRDLFPTCKQKINNIEGGIILLKSKLKSLVSFLIVIDDVDDPEQLNALVPFYKVNRNSLVIVIAREESVLEQADISVRYKIEQMDSANGSKLFVWHASQREPTCGSEGSVERFLGKCEGLPLSLQLLGGHAFNLKMNTSQLELEKFPGTLESILELSYGALQEGERNIFLDIACLFIEKEVEMAKRIWKARNWDPESALQNLRDRCLIDVVRQDLDEEPPTYVFRMDEGIRVFGTKKAESEEPKRVCLRPHNFLDSDKFQDILTKSREESTRCLGSMKDMSTTYFLEKSKTSSALQWLELRSTFIRVSTESLQDLEGLRVTAGVPKRLWQQNDQASWKLKELLCKFTIVECIQKTTLQENWKDYSRSLEKLSHLECLILRSTVVSKSHRPWNNVKVDWNSFVEMLMKFTSLKILNLSGLDIVGVSNYTSLRNLESLTLSKAAGTSEVSISGEYYPNLRYLKIEEMQQLTKLDLKGVKTLKCLEVLSCRLLESVLCCDISNLEILGVEFCAEIKELPDLRNMSLLKKIRIIACEDLQDINGIKYLSSLEDVAVTCCTQLRTLTGIQDLKKLEYMILSDGFVWRCVRDFQILPSKFTVVMGRAALQSLCRDKIREVLDIADDHREFESRDNGYQMLRSFLKSGKNSFSAIILCAMVASSSPTYMDRRPQFGRTIQLSWTVEEKEKSIYTIVVTDPNEISMVSHSIPGYCWMPTFTFQESEKCFKPLGEIEKGYILGMNKEKACDILRRLTNILYIQG